MHQFENYLNIIFNGFEKSMVIEAMNYSLLNPGKRVRSCLFFEALKSLGISENYYEIGACVEMIHTYSLIHDDLPAMDNATLRRGQKCTHIQYPESIAILAGDGLLTESFNEVLKTNLDADIKVQILGEVINAAGCKGMIYGQELDLLNENIQVDERTLSKIHFHKTGAMIILPVRLACIIAKRNDLLEKVTIALKKYGLAFQVKDDILDLEDKSIIGKDGDDIVNQKSTYPKVIGVNESIQYYNLLITESLEEIKQLNLLNDNLYQYMQKLAERTF